MHTASQWGHKTWRVSLLVWGVDRGRKVLGNEKIPCMGGGDVADELGHLAKCLPLPKSPSQSERLGGGVDWTTRHFAKRSLR